MKKEANTSLYLLLFSLLLFINCKKKDGQFDGVNGTKIVYWENGSVRSKMPFKDGMMHGLSLTYFRSGKLQYEINYKKSVKNGLSKVYYENGSLASQYFYTLNKKDSLFKEFFDNGKLKKEGSYKKNLLEGKYKIFHKNGNLSLDWNYKEGKKHGEQKTYYDTGQLKSIAQYLDGRPGIGLKEYTIDGKTINHGLYILMKEEDRLSFANTYKYLFKLNKESSDVKFYMGELDQKKFFPISYFTLQKNGDYFLKDFYLPKYAYLLESFTFFAVTKTHFNNDLILIKKVNAAINHF